MATRGITSIDGLAELLGISRATAFRIMAGTQEPTPAFLAGIRSRLGLPFDLAVEALDPSYRSSLRTA